MNAPAPGTYPTLILKRGKERAVRNRHPWVYSGAVHKVTGKPAEGDVVAVVDETGAVLAWGHYQPGRTIVARLFDFGGLLTPPDTDWWMSRFRAALACRRTFLDFGHTNGYRLFHAEGDSLPGIICDMYGEVASVQIRSRGAARLLPLLQTFLQEEAGARAVYVQTEKEDGSGEEKGSWVLGSSREILFTENGHRFHADVEGGQKTGFFLDQRDNRALVGEMCRGRKLLNAFSYTGAFSVYALAGGAREVHSLDSSAAANALCEQNIRLNFSDPVPHQSLTEDCFRFLKDMEPGAYDAIILDPPAFTKHISTVDKAARGYKEINLKAMQKIQPGGLLFTFSCSQHISPDLFRKIIFGAAADARKEVRVLRQLSQGADHPINIYHPEGEYLKGLLLYVS